MAAQYPGAAGTDANLFVAVNNLATSLTDNPLTSGATTVNVAATAGFPTAGYITIDSEAIAYTGTTGTSFTGCTRGADGTTAASHVTTTQVFHDVVAAHHNVLKDEIKAIETDLVASYTGGSTTIATTFAKYLKLIGGTLSGAIAMGANKITGLANGTVATDAAAFGQLHLMQAPIEVSDGTLTNVTTATWTDISLTTSITPGSVSSKVLVIASLNLDCENGASATIQGDIRLVRGAATVIKTWTGGVMNYNNSGSLFASGGNFCFMFLDSPASTSSTAYKIQIQNAGATGNFKTNKITGSFNTLELLEVV